MSEIQALVKKHDVNNTNSITFDEFKMIIQKEIQA